MDKFMTKKEFYDIIHVLFNDIKTESHKKGS